MGITATISAIGAGIASAAASVGAAATTAAAAVGVGAATAGAIGSVVGPALVYGAIGAGTGALSSAVTGGDIGMGALGGAITGGVGGGLAGAGVGSALGGALGASPAVGNALIGAGVGALSSGVTGGNPITGALSGGVTGYLAGSLPTPGQAEVDSLYGAPTSQSLDVSGNPITVANTGSPPVPPPLDSSGNPIAQATGGSDAAGGALNAQSAQTAKTADSGGSSGLGKLLENPSVILGALSALSSAMNKPQQGGYATPGPASNAANLGPLYNTPLNTNVPGRTAVAPNVPNWYTYGQIPGGATYFQNNSLKSFGFARGGALSGEFTTANDDRHVHGPGTETSDDVPALLSKNEYVLDAEDVRRIGGGSNLRGAKILDRERRKLTRNGSGALSRLAEAA